MINNIRLVKEVYLYKIKSFHELTNWEESRKSESAGNWGIQIFRDKYVLKCYSFRMFSKI